MSLDWGNGFKVGCLDRYFIIIFSSGDIYIHLFIFLFVTDVFSPPGHVVPVYCLCIHTYKFCGLPPQQPRLLVISRMYTTSTTLGLPHSSDCYVHYIPKEVRSCEICLCLLCLFLLEYKFPSPTMPSPSIGDLFLLQLRTTPLFIWTTAFYPFVYWWTLGVFPDVISCK